MIASKLQIERETAAPAIQAAAVAGGIRAEVVGWRHHVYTTGNYVGWVEHSGIPSFGGEEILPKVADAGWRHVDWAAGTLAGCAVQIFWADIRRLLGPLAKSRSKSADSAKTRRAKRRPSGDDASPLSLIPPDWVPVTDVETWLTRRFSVLAGSVIPDLLMRVRTGKVTHKVAGIRSSELRRSSYGSVTDPPGFRTGKNGFACVEDWDAAEVDWPSGTVNGRMQRDGKRERLTVSLYWMDVERWTADDLRGLRDKHNAAATSESKPDGTPVVSSQDELTRTWMHGFAAAFQSRGEKPKRDDSIKLCQEHMKAPYRVAEAAWGALPADWKNPPRKPKV